MISPNEEVLADNKCDVLETVMEGSSTKVDLPLSNWGNCPVVMKKGSKIGVLEEVTRIGKDDELWKDHSQKTARLLDLQRCDNRSCVVDYNLETHATIMKGER